MKEEGRKRRDVAVTDVPTGGYLFSCFPSRPRWVVFLEDLKPPSLESPRLLSLSIYNPQAARAELTCWKSRKGARAVQLLRNVDTAIPELGVY